MYYHVTTPNGVIYETDVEAHAYSLARQIKDAVVRCGSLAGLREKSAQRFGRSWLVGPSIFNKMVLAA